MTDLPARIEQAFAQGGIRRTAQRYAVLEHLLVERVHASAEEVFAAVNQRDPRASRATIYNSLNELVRAGLVRRVSVEAGVARYDAALEEHHHFLCDRCGSIDDVPWFPVSRISERGLLGKRSVRAYEITIRGVCEKCGGGE